MFCIRNTSTMTLRSQIHAVLTLHFLLHMRDVTLSTRSCFLQAVELQKQIVSWLWVFRHSSSKAWLLPCIYMLHAMPLQVSCLL